jgi:hypothetical protein
MQRAAMLRRIIPGRIEQERRTAKAMVEIYCEAHHGPNGPCADCAELVSYVYERLARCPFGDDKPTCFNCPVHCYRKDRREQIRDVMRFSGPRMMKRHPFLAILHLVEGRIDRLRGRRGARRPAPGSQPAPPT